MNPHHRQIAATALLILLLMIGVGWSYGFFAGKRHAAASAAADLAECRQLVEQIQSLRQRPSLAGSQEMQLTELARVIEGAAEAAQIPPNQLVRVWPEPARRVSESPYQEKPTQVLLRRVTLRQLTTFLHILSAQDTGLHVKQVRLSAPRGEEAGDHWSAETTLSYLIYAPRESTSRVTQASP